MMRAGSPTELPLTGQWELGGLMVDKLAGMARFIATLLAIVAGFVAIPSSVNVPLVLVILGLIAGLKYQPEQTVGLILVLIALPIVGSALAYIPAIGAQLNAAALNIQLAAAGVTATVIAMRLYNNSRDDVAALAGSSGRAKAATT
jgi:hypothetical protein